MPRNPGALSAQKKLFWTKERREAQAKRAREWQAAFKAGEVQPKPKKAKPEPTPVTPQSLGRPVMMSDLPPHLQAEWARVKAEARLRAYEKNKFFDPYPTQLQFIEASKDKFEILLSAGNSAGKCCSYNTLVHHPGGGRSRLGDLICAGKAFWVEAWDGERVVPALVEEAVIKPAEPMVRIWLRSGDWFECALDHRVLVQGCWAYVREVLPSLRPTIREYIRSILCAGVQRLTQTLQDCLVHCSAGFHLCDEPLLNAAGIGHASVPISSDAQRHTRLLFGLDGFPAGPKDSDTPSAWLLRLSKTGCQDHSSGRSVGFLTQIFGKLARRNLAIRQAVRRLPIAVASRLLSMVGVRPSLAGGAFISPYDGNKMVAWEAIPRQTVYDISVPAFNCYFAGGWVHHNTECGAYVTAMHLTGEYPEWWPGRRWTKPIDAWVCGKTAEAVRDAAQLKLVGRLNEDQWGTGMIPRRLLPRDGANKSRGLADTLDTFRVQHVSGGWSNVSIKTYAQEPEDWQGPRLDLIWFDEEPKTFKHYTEALARLMGRNGLAYMTFTPLAGPTEVVKRFTDENEPTRVMFEMSMDEAKHISDEEKARKFREYPHYERDARYHGKISLGEGAVWTVPEEDLLIDLDPNDVPLDWLKLWGIDFGINHPFGATLYAWDRDRDDHYILAEVRMSNAIPLQHADAMRRIAGGVPVAWPRDGLNREKSSGEALANSYRKQLGVQMLGEPATFPEGGNSLYAGVREMGNLMQARRWKVNRSCTQWLTEYRRYHFRDGKIVAVDDDLLSASRYAYMMRRRAKPVKLGAQSWKRRGRRVERAPAINPWTGRRDRPAVAPGGLWQARMY